MLLASGARIIDLYDLLDRAGSVALRFTRRYINIPLTAAITGVFGNRFGGDALDWNKLIYTPLVIVAAICTVAFALKLPRMLNAAKRRYTRIQGQVDMVQLKRNRRRQHAHTLWHRHFKYHSLSQYPHSDFETNESHYLAARQSLVDDLDHGLSTGSIDHLELKNSTAHERRQALARLALAMEYESPASDGAESCETAFYRTLIYSLRSEESQTVAQEKSGYAFREYKSWLRRTFFDPNDVPLAARLDKQMRLHRVARQLKADGVSHDPRLQLNCYFFASLTQMFWHKNTTRKVNLRVGTALGQLSRKFNTDLTVQSVLWPGNHLHQSYQVSLHDGSVLGDELRQTAKTIIRSVYGNNLADAQNMLDRATLNNFAKIKGLRVLCDIDYCTGTGLDQSYLQDLKEMDCSPKLYHYHQEFVARSIEAVDLFSAWLDENHPGSDHSPRQLAALRDAFHRNWHGLRERLGLPHVSRFNINRTITRRLVQKLRPNSSEIEAVIGDATTGQQVRSFEADRDAIRLFDCVAHLEHDTYLDLITSLGDFPDGSP